MDKKEILNTLLTGWNFFRFVRLIFAIVIIIQAVMGASIMLGVLGSLFLVQVALNTGCCATGNCAVSTPAKNDNTTEITYEEIK